MKIPRIKTLKRKYKRYFGNIWEKFECELAYGDMLMLNSVMMSATFTWVASWGCKKEKEREREMPQNINQCCI